MIKGITEKEETIIKELLKGYPYDFYYYGSRVNGDYTKSSDLDILAKSEKPIDYLILAVLERKFNESKIPYVVNISDYAQMDKSFYKLIEPTLVKIF